MSDLALDIVTGVVVPAAAIIVSTLVAVGLARSERLAAAAARLDERIDGAFVQTLVALAILNTINLRAENLAGPMRDLRVGLTLLEAVSAVERGSLLGEWFEQERLAGLAQSRESMRALALLPEKPDSDADIEAIVAAGAPLNEWARDFANNLRLWRRRGATAAEVSDLISSAKSRQSA